MPLPKGPWDDLRRQIEEILGLPPLPPKSTSPDWKPPSPIEAAKKLFEDIENFSKGKGSPDKAVIADLRRGAGYEGRFWFGSYGYAFLGRDPKGSLSRKVIPLARKNYNALRVKYGLEPVTDWTKRPDDTLEKKLRELL